MARPLIDLTEKGKEFMCYEACYISFEVIKAALFGSDVIGYPQN